MTNIRLQVAAWLIYKAISPYLTREYLFRAGAAAAAAWGLFMAGDAALEGLVRHLEGGHR
jgi:hypothetical protein